MTDLTFLSSFLFFVAISQLNTPHYFQTIMNDIFSSSYCNWDFFYLALYAKSGYFFSLSDNFKIKYIQTCCLYCWYAVETCIKDPTFLGNSLLKALICCLYYNPYIRDGGSVSTVKICIKEPTFLGDNLLKDLIVSLYNPYIRDGEMWVW